MLGTEFFDLGDFLRDLSTNDLLHVLEKKLQDNYYKTLFSDTYQDFSQTPFDKCVNYIKSKVCNTSKII